MSLTRPDLLLLLVLFPLAGATAQSSTPMNRIDLYNGWMVQTSREVGASGQTISTPRFQTEGWYRTSVPMTVFAVRVAAEDLEPYFGMSFRDYPGISYDIGKLSRDWEIQKESPYYVSWWYRTEFPTPTDRRHVALHFDGINYRANVWINGKLIGNKEEIAGAYRTFEYDITRNLAKKGTNVVAVEIFPQTLDDLGLNWADWNPTPPDKNMGLWQDVYLTTSGPVKIRYPAVVTHLLDKEGAIAELTIVAELQNVSDNPIEGEFKAEIAELSLQVKKVVALPAREKKSVKLGPRDLRQLVVKQPKLWWPKQMEAKGSPKIYDLHTSFLIANVISDSQHTPVGIREITSEWTERGARVFLVNGKRILIRGAGWAPDMMLRRKPEKLRAEFEYFKDLNLNTIRLEGPKESEEFFKLADEEGILIIAGWCCCDRWEQWCEWKEEQKNIAVESVRSQSLRLRAHPSLLVWLNGSDKPPPCDIETKYIEALEETSWPNPIISSASRWSAESSGPSGLKMGPYDYHPPVYWLLDKNFGGAYGFNTETSPGPAVPTPNSLKKFIPADHLWPVEDNKIWNFHAASGQFKDLKRYNDALRNQYGPATDLDDYNRKSQAMAYDSHRAMFEAYSRNKYTSTGVIQWMLNNAWPSLFWHLYDYYLEPAGGYFGTKKANEPVHIMYSYDDRSIAIVNSRYQEEQNLRASVRVFDFDLNELFSLEKVVDIDADSVKTLIQIPDVPSDKPTVYFIQLTLMHSTKGLLSSNLYWLSTQKSVLEFDKTDRSNAAKSTPISRYEDMTRLSDLPKVHLEATADLGQAWDGEFVRVRLKNTSAHLAFQVRLAVEAGEPGEEVLPVLWGDNYVSLLPGEDRTIDARFPGRHSIGLHATLKISGWNIEQESLVIRTGNSGPL